MATNSSIARATTAKRVDINLEAAQTLPMAEPRIPKKFWWVVAVAVPLATAVIAVVPNLLRPKPVPLPENPKEKTSIVQTGTGNVAVMGGINISGSDLSQKMYFTTVSVIAGEYEKAKGQPLSAELRAEIERAVSLATSSRHAESSAAFQKLAKQIGVPGVYNNLAVAHARAGQMDDARKALAEALQLNPDYPGANLNQGILGLTAGRLGEALPVLEKAAGTAEGKALVEAVRAELDREAHTLELEPNDDVLHPTRIPLDKSVEGALANERDQDFFTFTTPSGMRDVIDVKLNNRSATLKPTLHIFGPNRSAIGRSEDGTPGASLDYTFSAHPNTVYYVGVGHYLSSAGAYRLTVKPMKKYDRFEPNEDWRQAKVLALGTSVDAEIMDSQDQDCFKFTTSAKAKSVKVSLENRSATLKPAITIFGPDRSQLGKSENGTAGANVSYSFTAAPDSTYYITVGFYLASDGAYSLLAKEE